MGTLCSMGEAQGWLTASGVSYTNEGRGREGVLSGVQEAATDSPSPLYPSVSKSRQQIIKCCGSPPQAARVLKSQAQKGKAFPRELLGGGYHHHIVRRCPGMGPAATGLPCPRVLRGHQGS